MLVANKGKGELIKEMPLWIEQVLKYARLESAKRLSIKKALEAYYDDAKKDYECYDDIDAIHFLIMLNTLMAARSKIGNLNCLLLSSNYWG